MRGVNYNCIAYQTLEDRDNADEVERDGPYMCKSKNAWLTEGYYFWDDNIDFAKDWGKVYRDRGCIIIECKLNFSRLLDLVGSTSSHKEFEQLFKVVQERGGNKDRWKFGDIVRFLREMNKKRSGVFPYEGIRVEDYPKTALRIYYSDKGQEFMLCGKRIQICLFAKNSLILPSGVRVVYPEKYVMED